MCVKLNFNSEFSKNTEKFIKLLKIRADSIRCVTGSQNDEIVYHFEVIL